MTIATQYISLLTEALQTLDCAKIDTFVSILEEVRQNRNRIYICGNGGSAGNALHIANDFSFGINPNGPTMDIEALPANTSVVTCLANDIGYENIFSYQIKNKGKPGDLLWILSGSGNSDNIVNALNTAKKLGMITIGIVGFDGGLSLKLLDHCIHLPINDMQISEDIQLVVGHIAMKELKHRIQLSEHLEC
ncbi:putative phosphoheptose isomerase [Pseudoalteromonas luteoviolacea B = ATCC 29581]|nr:putative phosphoheptose isomerase [Pseudoalteromonas luteoviolacea B = ATCC 29581]